MATIEFNLFNASEGGYQTGHSNFRLISSAGDGNTYGCTSASFGVTEWVNPFSSVLDGYLGDENLTNLGSGLIKSTI